MGEDANPDVEIPARVLEVQDDLRLEVGVPDVDAAQPPDPLGIRYWSPVEIMQNKLRLLHALVCRTKEHLWKRLLEFEEVATEESTMQRELAAELEARRQGLSEQERSLCSKTHV